MVNLIKQTKFVVFIGKNNVKEEKYDFINFLIILFPKRKSIKFFVPQIHFEDRSLLTA